MNLSLSTIYKMGQANIPNPFGVIKKAPAHGRGSYRLLTAFVRVLCSRGDGVRYYLRHLVFDHRARMVLDQLPGQGVYIDGEELTIPIDKAQPQYSSIQYHRVKLCFGLKVEQPGPGDTTFAIQTEYKGDCQVQDHITYREIEGAGNIPVSSSVLQHKRPSFFQVLGGETGMNSQVKVEMVKGLDVPTLRIAGMIAKNNQQEQDATEQMSVFGHSSTRAFPRHSKSPTAAGGVGGACCLKKPPLNASAQHLVFRKVFSATAVDRPHQ